MLIKVFTLAVNQNNIMKLKAIKALENLYQV